ncbi:M20 metallopeptidase family protein [Candidatus Magnetominusculus xianensis]|uniref:Hydrolase YxeP n=1 Tax=Candidatus Magnetominusculus xianensis TaxID=1748249 RepID=A0ABR5SGS6_9BACT|nr:M20 family metallopeptidase [Candidatus Magnetominusculus xianensis]KWT90519.1 putative hydrolase YxeP [Candidatus Magnetominusculus xianensis]
MNDLIGWMRAIRREIHRHPELGFNEHKTAALITAKLVELGIEFKTAIAQTGVAGFLGTHGPVVALRADMDALPVTECTGLPFASETPGVMHACGHDGHVAIVLGAAYLLKEDPPDGRVVFIFQPNEEGSGGAKPMIAEGILDGVDAIFAGHIDPRFEPGKIILTPGVNTAYTDGFDVEITGRAGHAARPHEAVDAVMIACSMVMQIQTIISRSVDPLKPAVITIGEIKGGTVNNVIAEHCLLKGTIRTLDDGTRQMIFEKLKLLASSLEALHGAKIGVKFHDGYPPLINHPGQFESAREAAALVSGSDNVVIYPTPSMGGEDFAFFLEKVPGCFVRFGARKKGHEGFPLHNPNFDFDEEALKTAAEFMASAVRIEINKLAAKTG